MEPIFSFRRVFWLLPSLTVFLLGVSGCNKPELSEPEKPVVEEAPPEPVSLPVDRMIYDLEGRSIEATIIGREVDSITIVRRSDDRRFDYPIDQLSPEDREFVMELRLQPAPKEEEPEESSDANDPYIKGRMDNIKRLSARLVELEDYAASQPTNQIVQRSYERDVEKINSEIRYLENQIAEYRNKNK